MRKVLLVGLLGVVFAAGPVFAQEALGPASGNVANLEGGFPTAIIDTTTTDPSAFEAGFALTYQTNGQVLYTSLLQVNYGLMEGLQLSASMPAVLGEGMVRGNGDMVLDVLWAFLAEEGNMPSMAVGVGLKVPTGEGYTGGDGRIIPAVTKTNGQARFHLHARYTTIGDRAALVRNDVDFFVLGMDYPLLDKLVLVVDAYSKEDTGLGNDRLEAIEVGVRAELTEVDTLSAGVSVGIGNGNATPDFTATVGYQRAL